MSVRKRGNCYQVVYRCPGEEQLRTETFKSDEPMSIKWTEKKGKSNKKLFGLIRRKTIIM